MTAYFKYKTPSLFSYFLSKELFSLHNINFLDKQISSLPSQEGEAMFNPITDNSRKSIIKWIPNNSTFSGLYNILQNYILESNLSQWNFDITFSIDPIQYTVYNSGNYGKYDWHIDGMNNDRKLSIVIQLTDPNEYEGGDLELYFPHPKSPEIFRVPKERGKVIVFPSYLYHRVTPVTKGIRKSLVWWVGGAPFR